MRLGSLNAHMPFVVDPAPVVMMTDSTGNTFGDGYGQVLGAGEAHPSVQDWAPNGSLVPMGDLSDSYTPAAYAWRDGANGLVVNPEIGGRPGRVSRLAYDAKGPATSTSVESYAMTGQRIVPGRPDIATGGPVGASGDLGQYLAVAMAVETYDFPAQDLAQLNVLLGL